MKETLFIRNDQFSAHKIYLYLRLVRYQQEQLKLFYIERRFICIIKQVSSLKCANVRVS